MSTQLKPWALEFEVLLKRAARQGRLFLNELLDPYSHWVQAAWPELANPRQVHLPALLNTLANLPEELFSAQRLLLVPNIKAFDHIPAPSTVLACGHLTQASHTLIGQAPTGHPGLALWASMLCLVAHELRKIQALQTAATSYDFTDIATQAFLWGHDPQTLQAAIEHFPAIQSWAKHPAKLPQVHIDARLDPAYREQQATSQAQHILRLLAEMGLLKRPMHIWLGGSQITECLSPYCREVGDIIWQWGVENQHITTATPNHDLTRYHLLPAFLNSHAQLQAEKHSAERTVGIYRLPHHANLPEDPTWACEVIDLGRIEPAAADALLTTWQWPNPAPVLLRLEHHDASAMLLESLFAASMGQHILSITAVYANPVGEHNSTPISIAKALCSPTQATILDLSATAAITPQEFANIAAKQNHPQAVQSGNIMAGTYPADDPQMNWQKIAAKNNPIATHRGSIGWLEAVYQAWHKKQLEHSVHTYAIATATTSALTTVALGMLQHLQHSKAMPTPKKPPDTTFKSRRIKA